MKQMFLSIITFLCLTTNALAIDSNDDIIKNGITKLMQENNIPGAAVTVVYKGKATSYYFGFADDAKKIPVSKNTIFEIGSITKVMTSFILAKQLDAAKADLDTSITHYLPNLPADYEDITLRNLATHTSGLPLNLPEDVKTDAEMYHYFATHKPLFNADEGFQYSNVGMGLLGRALEKMTHEKMERLYQRNIQKPMNMSILTYNVPAKNKKSMAVGHDEAGVAVPSEPLGLLPASGDLKASAEAMSQFLLAAVGNKQDDENIMYPMRSTQSAFVALPHKKQGLGWLIHSVDPHDITPLLNSTVKANLKRQPVKEIYELPKYDGNALIDKSGTTKGFRAYIGVVPYKEAGISILVNKQVSSDSFIKDVRQILFTLNDIKPASDNAEEIDNEENN